MTANIQLDDDYQRFNGTDRNDLKTGTSPLGRRYSESLDAEKDHVHLVQDAMLHSCNNYCLGEPDKDGTRLRCCRFGFGKEMTSNKGDTPGKPIQEHATIEKNIRGVEHLLLTRLHSTKINQHSRPILQAWRANADVQLIVYRSNPRIPDVGEIEAVSRYCTAYASKTHQTTRQEISTIQDIIIRYDLVERMNDFLIFSCTCHNLI